jgi:hypothetical protein
VGTRERLPLKNSQAYLEVARWLEIKVFPARVIREACEFFVASALAIPVPDLPVWFVIASRAL